MMFISHLFIVLFLCLTSEARKVVILDNNVYDSVVISSPPVQIQNSRYHPKNKTEQITSRMMKECPENDLKCNYDQSLSEGLEKSPKETVDEFIKRFASVTNVKVNNEEMRNSSAGKAYWNQINAETHNHPYDDSKGWVTLEPIPWSSSQVSKWKPASNHQNESPYGPPQQGPTHNWMSKPGGVRPGVNWGLGSNDIITDEKPSHFSNSYSSGPQNGFPAAPSPQSSSHPHIYTTSHKVPLFASSQSGSYPSVPHEPEYNPYERPNYVPVKPAMETTHYGSNGQTLSWQSNYNFPQSNYQHEVIQNTPKPWYQTTTGHPPSYPSEGNGEWVLLSTTKGYSLPQRYQDRKFQVQHNLEAAAGSRPNYVSRSMRPKYEEKDLNESIQVVPRSMNRKSDEIVQDEPAGTVWKVDGINILHSGPEPRFDHPSQDETIPKHVENPPHEMTFKRTVRLTVLPPLANSTKTMTTSHGDMLEVDASPHTVEEEQREQERIKGLRQVAVVTTGTRPYRPMRVTSMVPNIRGSSQRRSSDMSKKRAAILAAVGAGMIPATMAVLLPVALGRKRRSIDKAPLVPPSFIR